MIPVSSRIKAAFQSDSMKKTYLIDFVNIGATISNESIASESMTLTEPLCSEEQLHFGRCEAATFECEVAYSDFSFKGQIFDVYLILGDYEDEPFTVGRYVIDEETIENDRLSKSIVAYDIMYILNTLDVTYWAYTLAFPMTIKQLRDSLMEYVGQDQVDKTLPNDDILLDGLVNMDNFSEVSFEQVMTAICEWNGCFGHINREGLFDYIFLPVADIEETYPSRETLPSHDLFPASVRSKNFFIPQNLTKSEMEWSNYMCKTVDIIQVRNNSGQIIREYGIPGKTTTSNVYVIQNNMLTDYISDSNLDTAIQNFANTIKGITYKPCDVSMKMDLSYEVGDPVTFTSFNGTRIPTYILKRTMTGDISAFDEIEATGYEEWVNESPSIDGMMGDMMDSINDLDQRVSDLEAGDGNIRIESVEKLPTSPEKNVLYLVQGKVVVN
jgi:hypothetical protein